VPYLATGNGDATRAAQRTRQIGALVTPRSRDKIPPTRAPEPRTEPGIGWQRGSGAPPRSPCPPILILSDEQMDARLDAWWHELVCWKRDAIYHSQPMVIAAFSGNTLTPCTQGRGSAQEVFAADCDEFAAIQAFCGRQCLLVSTPGRVDTTEEENWTRPILQEVAARYAPNAHYLDAARSVAENGVYRMWVGCGDIDRAMNLCFSGIAVLRDDESSPLPPSGSSSLGTNDCLRDPIGGRGENYMLKAKVSNGAARLYGMRADRRRRRVLRIVDPDGLHVVDVKTASTGSYVRRVAFVLLSAAAGLGACVGWLVSRLTLHLLDKRRSDYR
jgi:hypothetical protein